MRARVESTPNSSLAYCTACAWREIRTRREDARLLAHLHEVACHDGKAASMSRAKGRVNGHP